MIIKDILQRARDTEDWDLVDIVINSLYKSNVYGDVNIAPREEPLVDQPLKPEPPEIEIIREDQTKPKKKGRQGKKKGRLPEGDFIAPSKGEVKEGKKRVARREPMNIPKERKNRFKDDQKVHAKELVTEHPELGVPHPLPRGDRSLLEDFDIPNTGQKVEVQCCLCGGWFETSPALSHGYDTNPEDNVWKCNDCNTGTGREHRRKRLRDR